MRMSVIALALMLTACTTATRYERQPWATVQHGERAKAECDAAIQIAPTLSYDTCMESKGWKPVY